MQFVCPQKALAWGIGIAGRSISTRSTLPILANILIAAEGGRVRLSATNLEVSVNCLIEAEVRQPGTTTVPARLLSEFINSLPEDLVTATLTEETQTLNLRCERIEANIKGLHPKDFPVIPEVPEIPITTLETTALRSMINLVEFAASPDDSRPVFTGVLVKIDGNRMDLAAADGYRLAVFHHQLLIPVDEPLSVIIPARALSELARILADQTSGASKVEDGQPVAFSLNSTRNHAMFKVGTVEVIARLIEGQFPNYEQIIPREHYVRALIVREQFLSRVKIASFFARDNANIVRLQFNPAPGTVVVSATGDQLGDSTSEVEASIEERVPEETHEIAFNSRYLAQVLERLDTSDVIFDITTKSAAGVIRPAGDDSYVHVVMPMALA